MEEGFMNMKNVDLLAEYREYLITERDASENTMSSYMRDLKQLQEYLPTYKEQSLEYLRYRFGSMRQNIIYDFFVKQIRRREPDVQESQDTAPEQEWSSFPTIYPWIFGHKRNMEGCLQP